MGIKLSREEIGGDKGRDKVRARNNKKTPWKERKKGEKREKIDKKGKRNKKCKINK